MTTFCNGMLRPLASIAVVLALTNLGVAQVGDIWRPTTVTQWNSRGEPRIKADQGRVLEVDIPALGGLLRRADQQGTIDLPLPEGGTRSFRFWPNGLMSPGLAERYPGIRTFSGVAVDDPLVKLRMEITPQGFHAMVLDPKEGDWFADPYVTGDPGACIIYRKRHFRKVMPNTGSSCNYDQVNDVDAEMARTQQWMAQMDGSRVGDCQMRTYRLALACTGEYANFHGSNSTNNDRSLALGAMVTTMDRVNAQFERDATLTMVLVENTDDLIYLDPSSDPYSNGNGGAMLGQNQTACDNIIGGSNYDIGHVFSTGGGGVAYLNSPCNSNLKAGGVTGQSFPVGDPFDIDYVAHEMGHQYGGNHTQNNSCNRAGNAAFEPGSASTIMGYAGICSPNVQNNSDAYFHGYSMQEMAANITIGTSSSCPQTVGTINQPPTVDAGGNFTIPRSTPFVLTATATDPNGNDALTYCWEQMNNQVSTQPPVATNTNGPNFRSLLPTTSPQRYFPSLAAVVANASPTWEVLSSVARTYAFRVTVRDNVDDIGCNVQGNVSVAVAGNAGPFLVTQPNTAVSWTSSTMQMIGWDVAGTTASPVSCANVDILLSVDGGFTYPFTLATGTPNDGAQAVLLPALPATVTTARIMVRGSGNIFYDISNTDFTISASPTPGYLLEVQEQSIAVCAPDDAVYTVLTTSFAGYTQPITLGVSGLPAGLVASFGSNPVTPGASTSLTISGTGSQPLGATDLTITATSAIGDQDVVAELMVDDVPAGVLGLAPLDGATDVPAGTILSWQAVPSALEYTVRLATDPAFLNVVESATGIVVTEYTPTTATAPATTYYWSVQAGNSCGTGVWGATRSFTTGTCIPVTVRITIDRYGEETTWQVVQGSTVFASGGPYSRLPANGTQVQTPVELCLPVGCYDLIVFDSFGDGNCCAYGAGVIRVEDNEANILAEVSSDAFSATEPAVEGFCLSDGIRLSAKVWLDGAYDPQDGLMSDALRMQGQLPLEEPYTGLGWSQAAGAGGETMDPAVLLAGGNDAIVDWVRLELRSSTSNSNIVAARQALLQRDGDIVDVDGVSPVLFAVAEGEYFVAVRHRNHLGCMTLTTVELGTLAVTVDLRDPATPTFGTEARRTSNGVARLWAGDVWLDGRIAYTGQENDRDPILTLVGGVVPTNTVNGYRSEDVNLDGVVKYTGAQNDRDPVLLSIGGVVPTNVRFEQMP